MPCMKAILTILLVWLAAVLGAWVTQPRSVELLSNVRGVADEVPRQTAGDLDPILLSTEEYAQHLVDGMERVQRGYPSSLDVEDYFDVLDQLRMIQGYSLDWLYHDWGHGGNPVVYARPSNSETVKEYDQLRGRGYLQSRPLLHHDGYPEGRFLEYVTFRAGAPKEQAFLQLAVLALLGEQFALSWHANYDHIELVCTTSDVQSAAETLGGWGGRPMPAEDQAAALEIDPCPSVQLREETASVRLVVFSPFGGFLELTYTFSGDFPHAIQSVDVTSLVSYHCGITF